MSNSRTEVRSPTRTEVRSPTRTSTRANTRGNFTSTVTGGAGAGSTSVTINIPRQTPNDTGSLMYPIAISDVGSLSNSSIGSALINMPAEAKSSLMGGVAGLIVSAAVFPKHKLVGTGVGALAGLLFSSGIWKGIASTVGSPTGK